ncbi:MAG: phosphoribosylamine--glycine ligase [Bacteroidales bacterium]|nr:phosphoribosylamine--glycine ligase [Bacteroidales bacterium]
MKILIIGRGGREHAIAWKLAQSSVHPQLFVAPGSDGMLSLPDTVRVPIEETDTAALLQFAKEKGVDLTVVGPEAALMAGIANAFQEAGLAIFAPTREAAAIEGSKQFAKELMEKYDIPTAKFRTFGDYASAKSYLDEVGAPIVVKYDGLAAGKGVVVAMTNEEADAALRDMLLDNHFGEGRVVMEEFLQGPEFSLFAMVNGEQVVPIGVAQDHKRAHDGDQGPNTGGMGAYTPVPIIPQEQVDWAVEHIMKPTAAALAKEGRPFCGILYGGLMLTQQGPKVIEFNARFGDPETEVVLVRLKSDLLQMILDILDHKPVTVQYNDQACLGVVMAADGYPGSYPKGLPIGGLDALPNIVFHMGTKCEDGRWLSNGGRVLCVVGQGDTLVEAQHNAYDGVAKISAEGLFLRKDIGWQAV